jgi:choline/glycine/proline betaine transport protein
MFFVFSLGLGTRQLNTGLHILNSDIPADDVTVQVIIIWIITAIATVSTVSGVGMGIRYESRRFPESF